MTRKHICLVLFFLAFGTTALFAESGETTRDSSGVVVVQEKSIPAYDKGDQVFALVMGPHFHLGTIFPSGAPTPNNRNKIGGSGSLGWDYFIQRNQSLGIQVGYIFSQATDGQIVSIVPIMGKYTWYPKSGFFDIPLSVGLGMGIMSKGDQIYFGPIANLGAGMFWNLTNSWELGLKTEYWFMPEFAFNSNGHTAFWNGLDLGISVRFNL